MNDIYKKILGMSVNGMIDLSDIDNISDLIDQLINYYVKCNVVSFYTDKGWYNNYIAGKY